MYPSSWRERIAEAATSKKERTKELLARLKKRRPGADVPKCSSTIHGMEADPAVGPADETDRDLGVISAAPNRDLVRSVDLIDVVNASERKLHAALLWPHIPPRAILPWMVREVSRGRHGRPLRTLFLNMGRPALRAVVGLEAWTERLRVRGLVRSGARPDAVPAFIGPDAHFYMFLGDTHQSGITAVPLVSIVPHAVALNDGTYWRDFEEKMLKGVQTALPGEPTELDPQASGDFELRGARSRLRISAAVTFSGV